VSKKHRGHERIDSLNLGGRSLPQRVEATTAIDFAFSLDAPEGVSDRVALVELAVN
jgi:hypothetical protein